MGGPTKVVDDFVADVSNTLTQVTQPIEKAVTAGVEDTSKNLTSALQPVEKIITAVSQDPKAMTAIAFAVAAPYAAASLAPYLSGLGAYAGVTAQAITNITIQVAQGVPIEKATENALVNVAISGASNEAALQINEVINSPGVTNAITSTVASGLSTAAKGGSQEEVEKAMTAGLAGSTASTIYKEAIDSSSDVISRTIGGATAGAVTGGTEGAVVGGLSSAISSLAKPSSKTNLAVDTGGGGEDFETYVDPSTSEEIASSPVAGLDITQDQSQAETERLARQNELFNLISPTETPEFEREPVYLGELPEVTITGTREQPYTPEVTLPSGYKIPRVNVYGSNQPARTDFTLPPSLAEPDVPEEETPAEEAPAEEEAPTEEAPADKPSTYRPDIFITTYRKPKSGGSTAVLGAALGTTGTTTGLTSSRGAGEIEGAGTGKARKKVWNEESLKLKDALGV